MRELRAYVFIDRMQPQYAAYVGATVQGDVPVAGMAELFVEMAPSNEIFPVADVALKAAAVRPATQYIEREFGLLEFHSFDSAAVRAAGEAILSYLGLAEKDRLRPTVASSQVITNVDPYQAQLINKFARGSLLVPGQTLCVMEVFPAAYAGLAMNEAEKTADVDVVYISNSGRYGRLFFSGSESNVLTAKDAAGAALSVVEGRSP
jgi:ethanolamine utilization microcompartment shell protein EutL